MQEFDDEGVARQRCPDCGWVYYRNPTAGVAVIILQEDAILLGRRKDETWCIPCGHVEWDEDIQQAAAREAREEIGCEVRLKEVFAVQSNFHDPEQHTVGIWFLAQIEGSQKPRAGGDLQALDFFPLRSPPTLAFPTDRVVLERLSQRLP